MLVSMLFAGDPVLEAIARDEDRISRTRNTPGPAVGRIQQALLVWDPTCLPGSGVDEQYGNETAAAVVRFKIEVLGVAPADVVDDVGPLTVRTLDQIQAAAERPLFDTTVRFTNEYGEPLAAVVATVTAPDGTSTVSADADGVVALALPGPADVTLDRTSTLAVLGDLLDRPWPPAGPQAAVVLSPSAQLSVAVDPGAVIDVVVTSRAALTVPLVAPLVGTPRVDGPGVRVELSPDGTVTLAVQSAADATVGVLVDPEPLSIGLLPAPELPAEWTPVGTYTVQEGDTAEGLALAFVGDPEGFAALSDHPPVPGEVLPLPVVPGWLSRLTEDPAPPVTQEWVTFSPDAVVAALVADGDPAEVHAVLALLDRPPAPPPSPVDVVLARVELVAALAAVDGPPLGPDPSGEAFV